MRAGYVVVLLAAVLPNVLYLGHGPTEAGHPHPTTDAHDEGEEHVQHCHVGPSRCAGSPSLVGTSWIGDETALPLVAGHTTPFPEDHRLAMPEPSLSRVLQPPQHT